METTSATTTDYEMTGVIHTHLAQRDLLPHEHLVDSGYMSADHLVSSGEQGIDLVGPVTEEKSWQAKSEDGFGIASFSIDWEAQQARCPQGHLSQKWTVYTRHRTPVVHFRFSRTACRECPVRALCTKSAMLPRSITIYPRPIFEALQEARERQQAEVFWQQYGRRAGIEGTFSQGNACSDLRRARYIGLAKTRLQHICTVLGLNVLRVGAWLGGIKPHTTHKSAFAGLALAPA